MNGNRRIGNAAPSAMNVGAVVLLASSLGCGTRDAPGGSARQALGDASASSSGVDSGAEGSGLFLVGTADGAAPVCDDGGLRCYVEPGCNTTLRGTVYDPAGVNPLYNAVVYVPNDPNGALSPIAQGTKTCNTCDVSIGDYVTATTSGYDGTFVLSGVPSAARVPLVVQVGKWRRRVMLSNLTTCADNTISGSSLTRLPADRSEGDIPQMALVTGGQDNLGCFLAGVGLSPSEYGPPHSGGRLDIYRGQGNGAYGFGDAPGLSSGTAGDCTSDNAGCVWNSKQSLEGYDIVLLACEGDTFDPAESTLPNTNKTTASKQALHDWLDEGGKVFATHYQYTWFRNSPATEFGSVADWLGGSAGFDDGDYAVDSTFTKGKIFAQWLGVVGALSGTQIALQQVGESVGAVHAAAQRWIYNANGDTQSNASGKMNDVKYFTFDTPIGGISKSQTDAGETTTYCGKAVFTDLHAGGSPAGDIPASCSSGPLSAQLKALEFLFFDLSACVADDSEPPPPIPGPIR
jgi:hypothetical protein